MDKKSYHWLVELLKSFSIIPADDFKQAIRIQRFFMALVAYLFCALLFYVSYLAGVLEWQAILGFLIIVPGINIILYIVFRTGLNKKMADPSLTIIQICAAVLLTMYGMYYANEARGVLLMAYVIILLFGIFRLRTGQFIFVSVFILFSYGVDILLLFLLHYESFNFRIEFLQLVVLALVLISFSFIAGNISSLRRNLSSMKSKLEKVNESIREMAIRDELTGMYNRRHIMDILEYEKNRAERNGVSFSIVLVDLDFFKKINDRYGHLAGDKVLQSTAESINRVMRNTDVCGRYGGEEFLLILSQTDMMGAFVFAERARACIDNMQFADIHPGLHITASFGLAEYRLGEKHLESILSRADKALYQANMIGRNRVEFMI